MREVIDRGPFPEKLRITADVERHLRVLLQHAANQFRGANRNGGFGHDNHFLFRAFRYRFGRREHVAQIGRTVFVGGRSHGDEDELRVAYSRSDVGGEGQSF